MAQPILGVYQGGTSSGVITTARHNLNAQNKLFYTVGFDANDDYVCDGVADNVQIQAAIDAAVADGVNHVHIRGNTTIYDIQATIHILNDNFMLTGDGKQTQLKIKDHLDDFTIEVGDDVTDIYNITLKDFSLDGNKFNQNGNEVTAGTAWGIYCWKAHNCTIDNVVANHFSPVGISFADASTHNKIVNCEGSYCFFDGFNINSSTDNIVANCIGQHNGHGGVISRYGEDNIITGNNFSYNDYLLGFGGQGVVSEKGKRNIITNNNLQYNYGSGVSVWDEEQVIIANNQCNECGFNGIRLDGVKRSIIKGNMCVNNGQFLGSQRNGIYLQKAAGVGTLDAIDNLIDGNWTSNTGANTTQLMGIRLEDGADTNMIINNHLQDATTHGISLTLAGANNVVKNNHNYNPDQPVSRGNMTGVQTFNRSSGSVQFATLTGNITATLTDGVVIGDVFTLVLSQDGTGSRILTMAGTNWSFAQGKLVLSTAPNSIDTVSFVWTGTLWRELSRAVNSVAVDATLASIPIPFQVTSNADAQTLFRFNMDRAWKFWQSGTGASTNLVLQDETGDKHFLLKNSAGNTVIDFLMNSASATASVTLTPQVAGQEGFNVTTTKTGRTALLSKIITNLANTANNLQLTYNSVVTDAATYAKSGSALQIDANNTQTSGTITDTSNLLKLTQSFAGATGTVLDINNLGSGKGIDIRNNATSYFSVTTAATTIGALNGVLKGTTGVVSGGATLTDVGTPTADFSMGTHKLTSVTDPTLAQDAATKNYVDSVAAGLDAKASCVVATTANIALSGTQTIDGVALIAGDRVLVKNQTAAETNGIYTVNASTWPRATDADTDAEVTSGMFAFITSGTMNANTGWVLSTSGAIVVGTTPLSFTQFSAIASINAGNGIVKNGSDIHFAQLAAYTTGRIPFASSTSAIGFHASLAWDTSNHQLLIGPGITLDSVTSNAEIVGRLTVGSITMNTSTVSTIAVFDAFNSLESLTNGTGVLTNNGSGGLTWTTPATGDVHGAAFSTDNALVRFDSTTGKLIQNSTVIMDDIGNLTLPSNITIAGGTIINTVTYGWPNAQGADGAILTNDSNGNLSWATDLTTGMTIGGASIYRGAGSDVLVTDGGTGASTNTAGFNNLSPATTQGDMIYHNGTNNVRLAKGTALQMLRMNSATTAPEWFTGSNRNLVSLASDVLLTSVSFANITGMSFPVTSGVNYRFYAIICYTASVATCGIRVSLTAPTTTLLAYKTSTGLSSTGSTDTSWDNYQSTTDSGTVSSSSVTTSQGNLVILEGFIRPSASGTVQLRAAIETATGSPVLTVKKDSSLEWW
jgi:parallel beta-helix repeat protein